MLSSIESAYLVSDICNPCSIQAPRFSCFKLWSIDFYDFMKLVKSSSLLNSATGFAPNTKLQDYFGEAMCDTNSCRMLVYGLAQAMDLVTNNNDWTIHSDLSLAPRYGQVTTNQIIDGNCGKYAKHMFSLFIATTPSN